MPADPSAANLPPADAANAGSAPSSPPAAPKPRRRWLRYSLRSLLLFMLLCTLAAGWIGHEIQQGRNQLAALAWVEAQGGTVEYDQRGGPIWQQRWLGNWYPPPVSLVDLTGREVEHLAPLRQLTSVQVLLLGGNPLEDLTPLAELPELQYVDLGSTRLAPEEAEALRGDERQLFVTHWQPSNSAMHTANFEVFQGQECLMLRHRHYPLTSSWVAPLELPLRVEEVVLWQEVVGDHNLIAVLGCLVCVDYFGRQVLWECDLLGEPMLVARQGDLQLVADRFVDAETSQPRERIVAIDLVTGQQQFEVELPLPVATHIDPFEREERSSACEAVEGFFLVTGEDEQGNLHGYVLSDQGEVVLNLGQRCSSIVSLGNRFVVQMPDELICYAADGSPSWRLPLESSYETSKCAAIDLADGDILLCRHGYGGGADLEIRRLDSATGRQRWRATCQALDSNVAVQNPREFVTLHEQGDTVLVYSRVFNDFLEVLRLKDGQSLERWDIPYRLY